MVLTAVDADAHGWGLWGTMLAQFLLVCAGRTGELASGACDQSVVGVLIGHLADAMPVSKCAQP